VSNIIGIVGQGFVGSAIKEGLQHLFKIETYDKFKNDASTCESVKQLCGKTKLIFICLPTPMKKDGSCDLSIIKNTIEEIDSNSNKHIAIIKSTVPPGTTKKLNKLCKDLQIVFNPEFLTEANYIDDFKNQNRIIIGGPRPASTIVKNMYRKAFQQTPIIKTGSDTAEMVKYFTNCFLATKVSFANEVKQICDAHKIDFDKVSEYALYDQRIGKTHLSVPGPDGKNGFGGSCFPKDLNALIHFALESGIEPKILLAIWDKNLEVRPEKDWELLKGRAISDE
jgi:nucleotide sugar dehydrogenase